VICNASGRPAHTRASRRVPIPADPLVTGPGGAQRRVQQRDAGRLVQDGDIDEAGTQPGQGMPGGDEDLVRPGSGQQEPDLGLGAGVVGDHQHRPGDLRQHGPVQPRPLLGAGRDVLGGHPSARSSPSSACAGSTRWSS
jgi:hypothetical protein